MYKSSFMCDIRNTNFPIITIIIIIILEDIFVNISSRPKICFNATKKKYKKYIYAYKILKYFRRILNISNKFCKQAESKNKDI